VEMKKKTILALLIIFITANVSAKKEIISFNEDNQDRPAAASDLYLHIKELETKNKSLESNLSYYKNKLLRCESSIRNLRIKNNIYRSKSIQNNKKITRLTRDLEYKTIAYGRLKETYKNFKKEYQIE